MNELTVIKRDGRSYIDSREVAALIGKDHFHLLRDIRGYVRVIERKGLSKNGLSDFFVESSYLNAQNKVMPCFLMSKKGAEVVANKLTGAKGVLFTCAYVSRFNEMEAAERAAATAAQMPALSDFNSAARLIVRAMHDAGAAPKRVIDFLRRTYEPLGIAVIEDGQTDDGPRLYTSYQIARMLGVFSLAGKPHFLAISSLMNKLRLDESHKTLVAVQYGNNTGFSVKYDDHAVRTVKRWFEKEGWPLEIVIGDRVYRISYSS